jgi:cell division protein FtsB
MLFAMVVVLVDAVVGEHGLAAGFRARREYAQRQAELASLRAENARLQARARELTHEPRAIEELARTTLGMIRRGEVLFIVRPVTEPAAHQPTAGRLVRTDGPAQNGRPAETHRPAPGR